MEKNSELRLKSDDILDRIQKMKQNTDQVQVEEDTVQIIIITLENAYYALTAESAFEIGENKKIFSVPGAPAYVLGIQNLRGDIASILSIKALLDLTTEDSREGRRVVYCNTDDNIIGFLVDTVEDVIDYPIGGIKQTLMTFDKQKKDFIQGEISYNNQHIPLLNIASIYKRATQGLRSPSASSG